MNDPASQQQLKYLASLLGYNLWDIPNSIQDALRKLDKGSASSIITNLISKDLESANKQFHYCGIKTEIKEQKLLAPERIIKHIVINS